MMLPSTTSNSKELTTIDDILKLLISNGTDAIIPVFTFAQSELDRYYQLEREVDQLRAEHKEKQELISETNTTSNHFWSPSSTKKILDRLFKEQKAIFAKAKPKVKEMKRLEQSLEVKAWTYRFGILEQIDTVLGDVAQNNICSAQGQKLFTSDKAFEAWNAQSGDLDRKVAYYAEKNGYISNCLEKKKEGEKASVDENWYTLCRKVAWLPDNEDGTKKAYRLQKENGLIVLSANLYFSFKGEDKDKKESFKRLQDAKPCMADFFAKHGIKLDLTFHEETGFKDWWSCDHSINLHTNTNRAGADNWASHGALNPNMDDSNRCSLYVHELSHKLGLPDTENVDGCPERQKIRPPDNIMSAGGSTFRVEGKSLYQDDLEFILNPLCGE